MPISGEVQHPAAGHLLGRRLLCDQPLRQVPAPSISCEILYTCSVEGVEYLGVEDS